MELEAAAAPRRQRRSAPTPAAACRECEPMPRALCWVLMFLDCGSRRREAVLGGVAVSGDKIRLVPTAVACTAVHDHVLRSYHGRSSMVEFRVHRFIYSTHHKSSTRERQGRGAHEQSGNPEPRATLGRHRPRESTKRSRLPVPRIHSQDPRSASGTDWQCFPRPRERRGLTLRDTETTGPGEQQHTQAHARCRCRSQTPREALYGQCLARHCL